MLVKHTVSEAHTAAVITCHLAIKQASRIPSLKLANPEVSVLSFAAVLM